MDTASDESSSRGQPALTPLAAAVLHVAPDPERVLQIGCGSGDGVLFLAREFPRARVRGIDRSSEAIHAAIARVGLDPEGRVAFKHSAGRRLPYPDAHFDVIVQTDGRLRFAEIRRLLRPGGHLVLVVKGANASPPAPPTPVAAVGGLVRRLHVRAASGTPRRVSWPLRRLKKHGLEIIKAGEVGDGAFCVSRLIAADPRLRRE
jgi:SAM-dependent methyltransferase